MPRVQFGRGSGPDWNPQTVLRQSHQRPSTECLRGGPDLRSVCPVGWTRARIIELERRAKSAFALRVRRLGKLPNSAPKLFESWTPFHERKSDRFTVLLPLGARAAAWLNKYVEEARSKLVVEPDEREVFLCVLAASLGAAQRLHSPPS